MPWLRTILRPVLAFIIAPATPALVFWAIQTAVALFRRPDPLITRDTEFPVVFVFAVLGYAIAIAVNLPIYVWFRSRGWNDLRTYLASGALQGFMIYPLYSFVGSSSNPLSKFAPYLIAIGTIGGLVAALCFWLIVRPDRSVKREELAPAE